MCYSTKSPGQSRLARLLVMVLVAWGGAMLSTARAAPGPRPSIWVTAADRAPILEKINTQAWARAQFDAMVGRSRERLATHRADPDAYLRTLPWLQAPAGRHPVLPQINENMASTGRASLQTPMQAMLGHAIDCGVLYFLTGESDYAQLGGDVLQALVHALRGIKPSDDLFNGGWLYPKDHLYEARILGAQLPILYDFLAEYLRQPGVTVWDLATRRPVPFDFAAAQEVFRTYTRLAVEHGMSDTNWPVLEMPSLAHNAMALEDATERAHWLGYVTHVDAELQDPLSKIVRVFERDGGVWPESFQYANHVAAYVTYVVALLNRQHPAMALPENLDVISRSMLRLREFRFPNGDLVRLGDGMRRTGLPVHELEMAYATAVRAQDAAGMAEFGGLLREVIAAGGHDRNHLGPLPRGAQVYLEPLSLLWFEPEITVPAQRPRALTTTDELAFAGLVLQRNLAPDGNPAHGLMAAVYGAHYVHGHASGMALELFTAGEVLATNAGKGTYRTEEHENYRRLFAGHNSVIVNGASGASGGWVDLGIDTVRKVAAEPAIGASAVSPRHSFTITRFTDRQVGGTTAEQERTVGIVRTSDRGGYYVDVFRSRTAQAEQFHDYVFHQVADRVEWRNATGPLKTVPAPDRFQPVPGAVWESNRSFLFPGWHYFQDVTLAKHGDESLMADFFAARVGPAGTGSRLHVPAGPGREYAAALAPVTMQAPAGYDKQRTPVVVIRQQGEAWSQPFAVVHEPYAGDSGDDGIREVTALEIAGQWAGLTVRGKMQGKSFVHLVLLPDPDKPSVSSNTLDLHFAGRYALISLDDAGEPREIYIGEGSDLRYRGLRLTGKAGAVFSAHAEKVAGEWRIASPDSPEWSSSP